MIQSRLSPSPLLLAALLIGGCAQQGEFPTLAERPIERELSGRPTPPCLAGEEIAQAPQPAPAPADDAALRNETERLLARAQEGERAFAATLPKARGADLTAAPGSETWIAAQQQVSLLEAARGRTAEALAELDALAAARLAGATAGDAAALRSALETARGLAEAQQQEIAALSSRLAQP